jgi:1,4-dihydroxy-2-naphthoate octaprenyltransferase
MDATAAPSIKPGSLRAWILACRPTTLIVGLVPVVVGAAVARSTGTLRILPAIAALFGAVFIQIGSNFANDVFDHEKGADTADRLGPTRATQSGLLTPRQMRAGLAVVMALAMAVGVYLTTIGGWPIVVIGLLSIASAIAYTGGPYPLGYNGLGDTFVFVFFGLVAVPGTVYVASGSVPPLAWLAALPVGAIATDVLVVNNVRDRATDVVAGKRTLAVRFGRGFGVGEYVALLALAYASPVAIVILLHRSPLVLAPLLSLPLAAKLVRDVVKLEGRALNATLAGTAKLLLAFGALFVAGIVASS